MKKLTIALALASYALVGTAVACTGDAYGGVQALESAHSVATTSSCQWCNWNYDGERRDVCRDGKWIVCLNLGEDVPYYEALENSYQYCRNQYNGLNETACIQGVQHCASEC